MANNNPKTLALAKQCRNVANGLSALARQLQTDGDDQDAATIKQRAGDLMQGANDLDALDAIDKLTDPDDVNTLKDLTDTMNTQAGQIAQQEQHATELADIADDLINMISKFKGGDLIAGAGYAESALSGFQQL